MDWGAFDAAGERQLIFIGGESIGATERSANESSYPLLCCLQLDKQLLLETEQLIAVAGLKLVSSIRRMRPDSNNLFVGFFQQLSVVTYHQKKFLFLANFPLLHSGMLD